MREHHSNDIVWFQFESLLRLGERVTHGIFSRRGGVSLPPFASLNAGPATADDPAARMENYRRIAAVLPGHPLLVGTKPQQGSNLKEITAADLNADGKPAVLLPEGCDAFITKERGVGLFWAVADCSVVLLVDPEHRAIGLAHAGWRGTRDAIVAKTITAMRETYGTQPDALVAAIAPTIGTCCYEVDEQVRTAFRANPFANEHVHFRTLTTADATGAERQSLRLDLAASNRAQLLACGVQAEHFEMSDDCPGSHTELFFSHRMEGGHTGRFAVVLGLR